MRNQFTFEREGKRWYVVLPEWEGEKDELEMIAGADMMLDILSQGKENITLELTLNPTPCELTLSFDREDAGGGWYSLSVNSKKLEFNNLYEIWLCHVTKFVFGFLPKNIFVNKIK